MKHFLLALGLFVIALSEKSGDQEKVPKDSKGGGYRIEDEINLISNQCCSEASPECCVSFTYISSESEHEEVPEEFGGTYYCETFEVSKTSGCGSLDYIVIPLSTSCDLTRVVWDLEGADGFNQVEKDEQGKLVINNADEFLLSPEDPENPTGFHALKFPLKENRDDDTVSICTQLQWGEIVENLQGEPIQIGFSVDERDRFKCENSTVRDICSIDASLATYRDDEGEESSAQAVIHLPITRDGKDSVKEVDPMDDPRFDSFVATFEYYWHQWVGLGFAVFCASIFFNVVMCLYWSALWNAPKPYDDVMHIKTKCIMEDDDDDDTEEESDDTEQSDQDEQHF
eukprot:CAMPEP_0197040594 /NCGR_PEP_ID=MMETSP1384-20130603/17274_1 /TAXON_ID=29189 /ORGANISM="Ammonia sp." /LENGTH=341 /DNA_ID=CAMNT_0042471383 /DNA_START=30 /DNA_END=1055 /DNA_ORIENTATION=-